MIRTHNPRRSWIGSTASLLLASLNMSLMAIGQESSLPFSDNLRAGGIEFRFASVEEGRSVLMQDDLFVRNLSAFDRQVRMRTVRDPGKEAYVQFAAGEVIAWREQDRAAVRKAIEMLDESLGRLRLPPVGPVLLVHTTGREESDAAYTRGSAIILPRSKTEAVHQPPQRLIAHELFHILSRFDQPWRDRLYAIIGFQATGEIVLPESLADRRITNPDAPQMSHVIRVRLSDDRTAIVTPVLLATSGFRPNQPSLYRYVDFKLMEVRLDENDRWVPKTVQGEVLLHVPSMPDFHRQIGANTGYIIHPDEILADNFAILLSGAEAKDKWLLDAMRVVLQSAPNKSN